MAMQGTPKRKADREDMSEDMFVEDLAEMTTEQLCKRFLPMLPEIKMMVDGALTTLKTQAHDVEALKEQVKNLEGAVEDLKTENTLLHQQANKLNLILSGLPEVNGESACQLQRKVEEEIKAKLKFNITIDTAFRLGKPDRNKPRLVKIKFEKLRDRNWVWDNRKSLGHPLYLNEDLHPLVRANRALLIKEAKTAKESNKTVHINWKTSEITIDSATFVAYNNKLEPKFNQQ